MQVRVRRWGNSLAVKIPWPLAHQAGVGEGTVVDLSLSEGRLLLALVQPGKGRLKDLLGKVTKANVHDEADMGPAVGREAC